MSNASRVPIEFRAQVPGRAQRQYIKRPNGAPESWKSDTQLWIDQWTERVDRTNPFTTKGLHIVDAKIDWRLISNSGTDEGIIRPVIGAGGWPLLPGSGIKGLFRRACPPDKLERWCGSPCASGDLSPGLLRFHGAWPSDDSWKKGLLDVAHPQQNWQVGFSTNQNSNGHSAFSIVSLFQPQLKIGLSSTQPLDAQEWDEIDATLKKALERGLGGRTVAGYGSCGKIEGDLLFQCSLEGQGPAAKLLDNTPEFRPTMFRAAIRGMALRLFGGITDERTAFQVVGQLFGSLSREEGQNVGLLGTSYTDSTTRLGSYGRGTWAQPVFATSGQLQWRQARNLRSGENAALLSELLGQLHGLVMTLGGFGRSWRRPDHRIFMPDYGKTPIGTHWQWLRTGELPNGIHVQSAADLEQLLKKAQASAKRWLAAVGKQAGGSAAWREVLAPAQVGIWLRTAESPTDAEVVHWFHAMPTPDRQNNLDPRDLKKTMVGGQMNRVGLIWNRLLPLQAGGRQQNSPPPGGAFAQPGRGAASGPVGINAWRGAYLEFVVLFKASNDQGHGNALETKLNGGAGAGFTRINF